MTDGGRIEPAGNPESPVTTGDSAVVQQVSQAAKSSAIGRAAAAEGPLAAFLAATGGWFGMIEALAPAMIFLGTFVVTENLLVSVIAPGILALAFIGIRLVRKEPVSSAIGGLFAMALSGFLALRSGQSEDFFLVGFWTNAAYLLVFVVSMLARWPLVGVIAGFALGQGTQWRSRRRAFWSMQAITACWALLFALRLIVQLPLYLAGNTQGLGIARMLMGPPLFGVVVVFTVLFVRGVYRPELTEPTASTGTDAVTTDGPTGSGDRPPASV